MASNLINDFDSIIAIIQVLKTTGPEIVGRANAARSCLESALDRSSQVSKGLESLTKSIPNMETQMKALEVRLLTT